jgi:hypothetical protein
MDVGITNWQPLITIIIVIPMTSSPIRQELLLQFFNYYLDIKKGIWWFKIILVPGICCSYQIEHKWKNILWKQRLSLTNLILLSSCVNYYSLFFCSVLVERHDLNSAYGPPADHTMAFAAQYLYSWAICTKFYQVKIRLSRIANAFFSPLHLYNKYKQT